MEAREVSKLHQRDSTTSNDEFPSYAQSIILIITRPTTHWVKNETLDLYSEGVTLSQIIHEGIPTTTKPNFVALPYLTSHSTFHECSRGTHCQPKTSLPRYLMKPVVIIPYSTRLERKITLLSIFIIHWNTTTESTQKKSIYSNSKSQKTFQTWYPRFQLPYQIDAKVTCTGFYVYVAIIYIDSSPDPEIFSPYVYTQPSDETYDAYTATQVQKTT